MSALQIRRLLRYLGTIGGAVSVVTLAVAFAIPASLDAVESRAPAKASVRVSYGQALPKFAAAEMNITHMLPVKVQKPVAPPLTATPAQAAAQDPIEQPPRYIISASSLNIRARPSSSSGIAASLSHGTEVEIIETNGSWRKVRHEGQALGWAYDKYLQPAKQADERVASLH